jgi:hypothetical protein
MKDGEILLQLSIVKLLLFIIMCCQFILETFAASVFYFISAQSHNIKFSISEIFLLALTF